MSKKIVGYGGFYCTICGKRTERGRDSCPFCGKSYDAESKYGLVPAKGAGGIGWATILEDPKFAAYDGNYKKVTFIWLIALSLLIPGILLATGELSTDKEGFLVMGGVVAVFWSFGLGFLIMRNRRGKEWEGVVENKISRWRERRTKDGNRERHMEYVIMVRDRDGHLQNLVYEGDSLRYNYYKIGDYLCFHNKKHVKGIEKYDKSNDEFLFCIKCGYINDTRDNFCSMCGCPLLKGEK